MNKTKHSMTWEKKRNKKFIFNVIVKNDNIDIERIHPLKQQLVNRLNQELKDERLECIYVFGSATNIRCNSDSDIDLAVKLKPNCITKKTKNEISEAIQKICEWNADIIWVDHVTKKDKIYKDIIQGVKIYE